MLQIEDHRKARYRNEKEEAAAPVVLVQPHQYKSTENITGWKVLGTGKLDVAPEKYYADYTAPDKVTEETREYVEISLKNVVNSQHPDRAGTSGQVITRTRIPLKVEDFNLYVNGAKMDVQYAYATVGAGFIRIQGMQDPNHTFELSISAGSKGTYGYGMAGESGKAIIYNSFVSGRPSRITTKQDCNTNQYIFSGGSVTISELDVAGGIAAGSFTATTWWPDVSNPSVCQYHEQKLSGDFRITIL
ncbi:hypothetical protein MKQ70_36025 [Chitinophaga sedimenti]|uniref:hypothetical protein n=1 Tax=Chitinophaga sedimenti TaxID=2033606 RepID=UPI002006C370|nr:hypothetical protein [Chitinophaga sedimenti]MCK7560043.1 hypothetical protein [Chitinophaga sedimenti]